METIYLFFFISCVLVEGIGDTLMVSRKIFIVQDIPALLALIILHL